MQQQGSIWEELVMQSKFIYVINANGEVVDNRLVDEESIILNKNETDKPLPDGLFKPHFDLFKERWYEGATAEELAEVEKVLNGEVSELTDAEKLAQTVSDLEIKDMEKDLLITQLGQKMTDLEIQLIESEGK